MLEYVLVSSNNVCPNIGTIKYCMFKNMLVRILLDEIFVGYPNVQVLQCAPNLIHQCRPQLKVRDLQIRQWLLGYLHVLSVRQFFAIEDLKWMLPYNYQNNPINHCKSFTQRPRIQMVNSNSTGNLKVHIYRFSSYLPFKQPQQERPNRSGRTKFLI